MSPEKSIDPAALEALACCEEQGMETAFDRAEAIKPCPIGQDSSCGKAP